MSTAVVWKNSILFMLLFSFHGYFPTLLVNTNMVSNSIVSLLLSDSDTFIPLLSWQKPLFFDRYIQVI